MEIHTRLISTNT